MVSQLQKLPTDEPLGTLEPVAHFDGAMPTGVTVSHQGRIFVNFPQKPYSLFRIRINAQPVLLR
ncbi:hypothetical protein [Nostoc sp. FACHB-892]|uniref:hypothetical protein n=1 Tax=Nostoc sp. FACHB-892 TaxID=2692843 RepID=UPI0018EF7270|nr:hypothetical protein [Nostoc sp. FACHB-892]